MAELDYVTRTRDTAAEEIARAEGALRCDLEKYRRFLLEQCEQESCRPSERCESSATGPVGARPATRADVLELTADGPATRRLTTVQHG